MQLLQAIPIASLLGSVVTMMLLNRGNEVTAMRAAGMNPYRIGLPIFVGAALFSLVSLWLNDYAIPKSASRIHYLESVVIQGGEEEEFQEKGHWLRLGNQFFSFSDYIPADRALKGVVLYEKSDKGFGLSTFTFSEKALFDQKSKLWKLGETHQFRFTGKDSLSHKKLEETTLPLPINPQKLRKDRRSLDQLSLGELRQKTVRGSKVGAEVVRVQVAYHSKIAFCLAALIISLIGIKFGYRSERTTEAVVGVLISIGLAVGYWFLLSAGKVLSNEGTIAPWLGPWLPNFVLASFGFFQMSRLGKP